MRPVTCSGDVHATAVPPLTAQVNVDPPSVEENVNVALVAVPEAAGPEPMTVSGAVVSAGGGPDGGGAEPGPNVITSCDPATGGGPPLRRPASAEP